MDQLKLPLIIPYDEIEGMNLATGKVEVYNPAAELEHQKECYKGSLDTYNMYKSMFYVGLLGAAYLGFKTFISMVLQSGPDGAGMEHMINANSIDNAIALALTYTGGIVCGLSALISKLDMIGWKRDIKKTEQMTLQYALE